MGFWSSVRKSLSRNGAPPDSPPGRNEPCWCGSGKKYKQCHLPADAKRHAAALLASCRSGST